MDIDFPKDFCAVIGESQGYLGLPIRVEQVTIKEGDAPVLRITSAWRPSPEEIERLNAGQAVEVSLYGVSRHPPITVGVAPAEVPN